MQRSTRCQRLSDAPTLPAMRDVDRRLVDLARDMTKPASSRLARAEALLRNAAAADRLARAEVSAARDHDGASWTDVGDALGVSRQTAHERFRSGPEGGASRLTFRPPER